MPARPPFGDDAVSLVASLVTGLRRDRARRERIEQAAELADLVAYMATTLEHIRTEAQTGMVSGSAQNQHDQALTNHEWRIARLHREAS